MIYTIPLLAALAGNALAAPFFGSDYGSDYGSSIASIITSAPVTSEPIPLPTTGAGFFNLTSNITTSPFNFPLDPVPTTVNTEFASYFTGLDGDVSTPTTAVGYMATGDGALYYSILFPS